MSEDPNEATSPTRFTGPAKVLHWSSVVLVLAMLVIGAVMVTTLSGYDVLLAVHRPLGIAILVVTLVRLGYRLRHRPPALPATMFPIDRLAARSTEWLLYLLLLAQPLIGWATVSASGIPVVLFGSVHLPAIAPTDVGVYATLHQTHVVLAYLLFFVFLAHMTGVLLHTLVLRDGVLRRMTWARRRQPDAPVTADQV